MSLFCGNRVCTELPRVHPWITKGRESPHAPGVSWAHQSRRCVFAPQPRCFKSQNHQFFCHANATGWKHGQSRRCGSAVVRLCSCSPAWGDGYFQRLSRYFCSKPGHSYQWGDRFGMCSCAPYLRRKEENRENATSVVVSGSSAVNWSRARMRPFALACHTYETLFYFLGGDAFLFFFFLLLPHFATASYSQLERNLGTQN